MTRACFGLFPKKGVGQLGPFQVLVIMDILNSPAVNIFIWILPPTLLGIISLNGLP